MGTSGEDEKGRIPFGIRSFKGFFGKKLSKIQGDADWSGFLSLEDGPCAAPVFVNTGRARDGYSGQKDAQDALHSIFRQFLKRRF